MDVVCRLGGDEFVVMIEDVEDEAHIITVAQKLLSTAAASFSINGEHCRVTASIGISIYPQDGLVQQELIQHADMAMYLAKEKGKNGFEFFSKDLESPTMEKFSLEAHLRKALAENELSLAYQAKVDLRTGAITGVEALLRWNSRALGSVPPNRFLPVAEETALIVPMGRWVLKTACRQHILWQDQGLPPLHMTVNLSLGN
jgi:predicted signal transduction protein with EAL and GGDEF domain